MAKIAVSFRLEPSIERLLKEAVSRSGKKQSEFLEAIVLAHLRGDKLDAMSEELTETKRELSRPSLTRVLGDAVSLGQSVSSYPAGDLNFDGEVTVLGDTFILIENLGNSNAS